MKKKYYVNKKAQSNGDHELHSAGCVWQPKLENMIYLGEYDSCHPAVVEAKKHYQTVNGCIHCCESCHTR